MEMTVALLLLRLAGLYPFQPLRRCRPVIIPGLFRSARILRRAILLPSAKAVPGVGIARVRTAGIFGSLPALLGRFLRYLRPLRGRMPVAVGFGIDVLSCVPVRNHSVLVCRSFIKNLKPVPRKKA